MLPNPKASGIEFILQIYADGEHPVWLVLAAKLETAKPFNVSKGTYPLILKISQALVLTPNGKMDRENPHFEGLLKSRAIARVSLKPNGNIRAMIST